MSASLFHVTEHIIPSQHIREYPGAVRFDQDDTLYLHVKQYVPRRASSSSSDSTSSLPSITIVATHGNGFPKESQEPLWDELLHRSRASGFDIASIWIADPTNQGLSYALNEDKLSDDPSWLDHSRDTLYMVNHFRSHMKRPIIGVGHSMGGAQLAHLAIIHPRLMAGLVLLDPVLVYSTQRTDGPDEHEVPLARLSTYRRDLWPSREEAAASMRKAPMFAAWDDRAWEAFVKHGLRDLPTAVYPELPKGVASPVKSGNPPVTLMTPIQQEVHTFMRPNFQGKNADGTPVINRKTHADLRWDGDEPYPYPFYRSEPWQIYTELPALRPSVLFVLGGESFTAKPALRDTYKLAGTGVGGSGGEAEGKSKRVILENIGHGVPFEVPGLVADHAAPFIGEVVREWKADEEAWLKQQRAKPTKDHVSPSDEWKKFVGPPLERKKPAKTQSKI